MPVVYDHLPEGQPLKRVDKRDFPYYEGAWAFISAGAVVKLWKSNDRPRRLISSGRYDLLPSEPDEPVRIQMWFSSGLVGNLPSPHSVPVQLELISL